MTTLARELLFETTSQVVDATALLSQDDIQLIKFFEEYELAQSIVKKQKIAQKICMALRINIQIEEEIFHPLLQINLQQKSVISAAAMNHNVLRYLVAELEEMDVDSDIYDIKIRVLAENVKEHIKEKQSKMFMRANTSANIDLWQLGEQLLQRKRELSNKSLH